MLLSYFGFFHCIGYSSVPRDDLSPPALWMLCPTICPVHTYNHGPFITIPKSAGSALIYNALSHTSILSDYQFHSGSDACQINHFCYIYDPARFGDFQICYLLKIPWHHFNVRCVIVPVSCRGKVQNPVLSPLCKVLTVTGIIFWSCPDLGPHISDTAK